MLDIYDDLKTKDHLPEIPESELSDEKVLVELAAIKKRLGDRVVVLGHHYQQDDVIAFADITGDSLELARKAAEIKNAEYVMFCGVHFMAETADMASEIDIELAQEARREAERALAEGFEEPADLARARASLQRALLHIRVAERRRREGPRSRG